MKCCGVGFFFLYLSSMECEKKVQSNCFLKEARSCGPSNCLLIRSCACENGQDYTVLSRYRNNRTSPDDQTYRTYESVLYDVMFKLWPTFPFFGECGGVRSVARVTSLHLHHDLAGQRYLCPRLPFERLNPLQGENYTSRTNACEGTGRRPHVRITKGGIRTHTNTQKTVGEKREEGFVQFGRADVRRRFTTSLPTSFQTAFNPPSFKFKGIIPSVDFLLSVSGRSASPSQLIRTLLCSPCTRSASSDSSSQPPDWPLSLLPLPLPVPWASPWLILRCSVPPPPSPPTSHSSSRTK